MHNEVWRGIRLVAGGHTVSIDARNEAHGICDYVRRMGLFSACKALVVISGDALDVLLVVIPKENKTEATVER